MQSYSLYSLRSQYISSYRSQYSGGHKAQKITVEAPPRGESNNRMRRVRYEQQRPVIASATRSSSLSRSCAWSCVCAWDEAGGGTLVSAIGSSCGSPCRRISARLILVAAGSILFVAGSNTAP